MREIKLHPNVKRNYNLANKSVQGQRIPSAEDWKVVFSNFGLIRFVAKRYSGRGIQIGDLVQEGIFGMLKAIEKFDPAKGFAFSTFAVYQIRRAILNFIFNKSKTIRVPIGRVGMIKHIKRIERAALNKYGIVLNEEEIASCLKVSREKILEVKESLWQTCSLEQEIKKGGEIKKAEGDLTTDPKEVVAQKTLEEEIEEAVMTLKPKMAIVISLRFGLDGGEPMTFNEIAKLFDPPLTGERIRQIENEAFQTLEKRLSGLKEYLYG